MAYVTRQPQLRLGPVTPRWPPCNWGMPPSLRPRRPTSTARVGLPTPRLSRRSPPTHWRFSAASRCPPLPPPPPGALPVRVFCIETTKTIAIPLQAPLKPKNPRPENFLTWGFGAGNGTRTRNLLITNQLRYQLRHPGNFKATLLALAVAGSKESEST